LLESLLQWLVTSKGIGALNQILMRVRAGTDPNPNVYATRWVLALQPFFARHTLRPMAKQFIEQNGTPLLRILGPDGSGRTYTQEYFDYLSDQIPGIHVAHARIGLNDAPSFDLEWLGQTLAGYMGITKELPAPSSSSYASTLCRWVLQHAMAGGEKWIFVFDGFDQPYVQADVVSFTHLLAERISMGEHRKRLRLVLIAYDKPISQVSDAIVLRETLPPSTTIVQQDLIDCLLELNVQRKSANKAEIAVGEMAKIADRILMQAPANGKERLKSINEQLLQLQSMQ
jgi:hypothetical protein